MTRNRAGGGRSSSIVPFLFFWTCTLHVPLSTAAGDNVIRGSVLSAACPTSLCTCYNTLNPPACYSPSQYRCINGNQLVPGQEPGLVCPSTKSPPPTPIPTPAPTPSPCPSNLCVCYNTVNPPACYSPSQYRCINGNQLVPGQESGLVCPSSKSPPPTPTPTPAPTPSPCPAKLCVCYNTVNPPACYSPSQYRCINGNQLVPGQEAGFVCPNNKFPPPGTPPPTPRPSPSPTPTPAPPGGMTRKFTIVNSCTYTVWPASSYTQSSNNNYQLNPGQAMTISTPVPLSGRWWGRTGCTKVNGNLVCLTNDPATLAEFTLAKPDASLALDFYDISNVDGFNIPISLAPEGSITPQSPYSCTKASCPTDINKLCPAELQIKNNGAVMACKSACTAFHTSQYCCGGLTPQTCPPTSYSRLFKQACPLAYSYAYDDQTSTFTCSSKSSPNYRVTFCPSS
eukprot:jgi/Botrbrau1/22779/Bobra.0132s0106.2